MTREGIGRAFISNLLAAPRREAHAQLAPRNRAELPLSLPTTTRLVPDQAGVLAVLGEYHPQGGGVAVFPCGAIQVAARD